MKTGMTKIVYVSKIRVWTWNAEQPRILKIKGSSRADLAKKIRREIACLENRRQGNLYFQGARWKVGPVIKVTYQVQKEIKHALSE